MIKADETLKKLVSIEKAVNEMVTVRQGILELKESEAQRQEALEELGAAGEKFRILMDHLPQKIFMKDKNSVIFVLHPKLRCGFKKETRGNSREDRS